MPVHLTSPVAAAIIRRMSTWARRLSPLAAILYAVVLVWIFSLEFAGAHRVESDRGAVSLSAWVFPGNEYRSERIVALTIAADWFETGLGLQDGVALRRPDGTRDTLRPLSFNAHEHGFSVNLEQDIELRVTNESEDNAEVALELIVPEQSDEFVGIEFPLSSTETYRFRRTANGPIIARKQAGDRPINYAISLPVGALYDPVNRRAVLSGNKGRHTIHSVYQEEPDGGTLATWFDQSADRLSDRDVEAAISEFVNTAFTRWRSDRYSPEHGTWTFADGGTRFDERIAVALLAEAWSRDDYARVRSEMRNAQGLHTDATSHRIAGYLGELNEYGEAMVSEIEGEIDRIRDLIEDDDPSVFRRDDPLTDRSVFNVVEAHAEPELLARLLDLAESADLASLEFPELLSLYEAQYSYPDTRVESTHERLTMLKDRIDDLLIPRVRNTENGFFMETGDQTVNVAASLRTGLALTAANPSDERVKQLGRHLIHDSLGLFDNNLRGPGTLTLDGMSIVGSGGHTDTIDAYPYLSENPRLPSVIPLPPPFEPGGFIWTIVDVSDIQVDENRLSFGISAPADRTHYLFVHGAPSVSRVSMFGLDNWRDDPNFEQYIRGRHYDPGTGTLSIKYTDEDSHSTIAVHY